MAVNKVCGRNFSNELVAALIFTDYIFSLFEKNLFKILMRFIIKCVFACGSYMIKQEFCKDCHLKDDCQEIYRQLGHASCPSVVRKVIAAFLLPLVVFIFSLAVFNKIFAAQEGGNLFSYQQGNSSNVQDLKTAVIFLMALLTSFVFVIFLKLLDKKLNKD